jgi:L-Ala-D/L-Glu epimerase
MQLRTAPLELTTRSPFRIAHGATSVRHNVLLHIDAGSLTGTGEAAVVPYYGETAARVMTYLQSPALRDALASATPDDLDFVLGALPPPPSNAALAAVDIALHDLWGQHMGQPLYRLFGLSPQRIPLSTYTITLPEQPADYPAALRAAGTYPTLKLKLGSGSVEADRRLCEMARATLPSHRLGVDANAAWTVAEALALLPILHDLGIAFVEQPVAASDFDGWRMLMEKRSAATPPLIADESVQGPASVLHLLGLVDGINIKLTKAGGLGPARRMIAIARAAGLLVMLGCMVESSVAITAAAHLGAAADFIDLDGNQLIRNDPYTGVINANGTLMMPSGPGLGIERRAPLPEQKA